MVLFINREGYMEFINQNSSNFNSFIDVFKNKTNVDRVMRLNIYVEGDDKLSDKYLEVLAYF